MVACAVVAWVFCMVLCDEGMIFNFYYRWIEKLPDWLFKPLGGCEYCFGGQLALWYYLIRHFGDYSLITHIVFVSGVIFLIRLTNKLIYGT